MNKIPNKIRVHGFEDAGIIVDTGIGVREGKGFNVILDNVKVPVLRIHNKNVETFVLWDDIKDKPETFDVIE